MVRVTPSSAVPLSLPPTLLARVGMWHGRTGRVRAVRIFIWHGYLLTGTGSNEYTQALARTLGRSGHDVTVFCQDPDADSLDLAGATVVRPELPGPLPVFVLDRYDRATPALLPDLPQSVLDDYVASNAEVVAAAGPADLLITNHVLLGGPVGAATGLPFVVKAHGSELEYAMRGNERLCRWAQRSLDTARGVIAGSQHIERVVEELVGIDPREIHVIPPGVNTDTMRPRPRAQALAGLLAEARADPSNDGNERLPDSGNAARLERFFADPDRPMVLYVGKLSAEKGVPLLMDAVRELDVAAVIVGFGPARVPLEAVAGPDVLFTGPLQHRHLRYLWPLATTSVVPSIFPEAFGMVAAEAASCGCPPLVADHSGLAEIAQGLRTYYPAQLAGLTSFPTGDESALRGRLRSLVDLDADDRELISQAARTAAVELWGWDSVAERILAIGQSG
ncbi:MAG: glycosyltransferase family 4 protein [Candidatus Nanopelagicales bacterium]